MHRHILPRAATAPGSDAAAAALVGRLPANDAMARISTAMAAAVDAAGGLACAQGGWCVRLCTLVHGCMCVCARLGLGVLHVCFGVCACAVCVCLAAAVLAVRLHSMPWPAFLQLWQQRRTRQVDSQGLGLSGRHQSMLSLQPPIHTTHQPVLLSGGVAIMVV